ncbi:MAG: hypothetical protein ACRD8A_12580 [Candidatus Acidiferrales bacterium]
MMKKLYILPLLLTFALPAFAQSDPLNAAYKPAIDCAPGDYPSNVSLTNSLAKLRQTADSPTSVTDYGITPLPCITVYASQNQFVSFQANVQAPVGGYAGITVSMSALAKTTGPGGSYTIPAPSVSNNNIVVYREAYATTPSANQTGHIWFSAAGSYPDILVPAIDPYWHQTTAAFPVVVAASQNQSAWIDVLVPAAAPSGWYSGTATISDSTAGTIAALPVLVAVWQWPAVDGGFMPSTPTMRSIELADDFNGGLCNAGMAYTSSTTCTSSYSGTGSGGAQYALDDLIPLVLDNRLSLSSWSGYHSSINSLGTITALETEYANGATTARLNTRLAGAQDRDIGFGKGTVSASAGPTWVSTFQTNGWFSTNQTFQYLCDEPPNGCSFATLNSDATTSRTATSPMLPLLVTVDIATATTNSALNSIDWMIAINDRMEPGGDGGSTSSQRPNYNTWLAGNCCSGSGPARQVWDYVSCDPNCAAGTHGEYPAYGVDNFAPAAAAEPWMVFRNTETGELYYELDGCFWNATGCSNPWGSQATSVKVYGDGNLLSVGTNSANCSGCGGAFVNVSQPIWLPTIRLKQMRDGVQDYEYLYLLNSLGGTHATVVTNAINEWIANGYCFNAVAAAGATVSDHAGACPSTGNQVFSGDLTDARIALGTDMQAITFPAGGTVTPPAPCPQCIIVSQHTKPSPAVRGH